LSAAPRKARPPDERPRGAHIIFERIQRFDKWDRGCWASVEELSHQGEKGDPNAPKFSISQTRRWIAWLREKGQIVYAGVERSGTNIYLLPTKRYDAGKVPVCANRAPLWSVEAAAQLFVADAPKPGEHIYIDGYKVNRRLTRDYSDETLRAGIAKIRASKKYPGDRGIYCYARLLEFFCKEVIKSRRENEALRLAAQARYEAERQAGKAVRPPRWTARTVDPNSLFDEFLCGHPKTFSGNGSRHAQPTDASSPPTQAGHQRPYERSQAPPAPS